MVVEPRLVRPVDLSAGREFSARQEEVLDELERIVLEEGFRKLTTALLAKRLRCSRRTLYELAPSKNELVLLVLDRLLRRMGRRAMERMRDLDDPADRLWAYLTRTNAEIRRGNHQLWADVAAEPAVQRLVDDHYRYAAAVAARLIRDGVDQSTFHDLDPHLVAELLSVVLRHLQNPQVLSRLGMGNAQANEQVFQLCLHGLSTGTQGRIRRPDSQAAS